MEAPLLFAGAATLLGAIFGSFLNVLLYRYNTGTSALRGRSRCMHCSHTLSVADLVPLLSYLFLRGRCRYCGTHLSLQYPLVELGGALLALQVYLQHPLPAEGWWFLHGLAVWLVLLFVVVYDLKHKIIPWSASGVLLALALGGVLVESPLDMARLAAGPLLALPLFLIWGLSRGRDMGLADAPLMIGLGWLLGWWGGLSALALAFWVGALVGIVLLMGTKRYTMKSEIPFAPFLIFGAWCVYFFHVDFFSSLILLWS